MSDVLGVVVAESQAIITKSAKELTATIITGEATATSKGTAALTEEEKIQQRIKKFGVQSENVKLQTRAQRFGTEAETQPKVESSKLNERAARFGIATVEDKKAAKAAVKTVPDVSSEALEKRAARFGVAKATENSSNNGNTDEQLSKRKERFGLVGEEDKKKLRSERFQSKA